MRAFEVKSVEFQGRRAYAVETVEEDARGVPIRRPAFVLDEREARELLGDLREAIVEDVRRESGL